MTTLRNILVALACGIGAIAGILAVASILIFTGKYVLVAMALWALYSLGHGIAKDNGWLR